MKKNLMLGVLGAAALAAGAATLPDVADLTMTQGADRSVRIGYTLTGGPAIVTLAVETNGADGVWRAVDGAVVATALGDVNRLLESGAHTIDWAPDRDWPDHLIADGGARAVVTAWPVDDPPDYMAVDLSKAPNVAPRVRWYPDAGSVPGGVVSNIHYRLSSLLMRRMHARNRPWMMGAVMPSSRTTSRPHEVTLTNDYYVGVFELTQYQWSLVANTNIMTSQDYDLRELHPAYNITYSHMRENLNNTGSLRSPTEEPTADSFLGKLRARTGIAFDLPSDAEWEFAAKGGHADGCWGNGAPYLSNEVDANLPGAYQGNTAMVSGTNIWHQSKICGTFAPNDYGLYDMHGNVWEWVRDSAGPDIDVSAQRIVRGGGLNHTAQNCRACIRVGVAPTRISGDYGARVRCPIDIRPAQNEEEVAQ